MKKISLFLPFSFLLFLATPSEGADETDVTRLRQDLLRNYDKNARPIQNTSNATTVSLYFFNFGIEYDEIKGVITLHAVVVLEWKDEHIKWDPLLYGNLTMIHFHPSEVWLPDISVENGFDTSELDHFGNTAIFAVNTSTIYWWPPAKLVVGCNNEVDYYRWPYDRQRCRIYMSSWAHDGNEIDLQLEEGHTKMDPDISWGHTKSLENREWDLVDNSIELISWFISGPDSPNMSVELVLDIQRRSSTHFTAVVIVAIGITATILISFWLNPFSNERLPVILVAFLLNSMYLNVMYNIIPVNGSRVPWIVCYFRDSLVMVMVALGWTICLRYMAKTKRNPTVPLPLWVDNILDGILGTLLCLNPRPSLGSNNEQPMSSTNTAGSGDDDYDELMNKEIMYRSDWGWFANVLDRIAFLIYLVVYLCFIITF